MLQGQLAIFVEDDEGLVFKEYCSDLKRGVRRGQRLADIEGLTSVVMAVKDYRELARFSPSPRTGTPPVPTLPH